jgi:hypothetical protein
VVFAVDGMAAVGTEGSTGNTILAGGVLVLGCVACEAVSTGVEALCA